MTPSHMSFVVGAVAGTSVRVDVIGGNNEFVVDWVLSLLCCSRVVPFGGERSSSTFGLGTVGRIWWTICWWN